MRLYICYNENCVGQPVIFTLEAKNTRTRTHLLLLATIIFILCNGCKALQDRFIELLLVAAKVHKWECDVRRVELGVDEAVAGKEMDVLLVVRLLVVLAVDRGIVEDAAAVLHHDLLRALEYVHCRVRQHVGDLLTGARYSPAIHK